MLGYAFMGKAHANAYRTLPYMTWPPPLVPELVAIAGRDEEAVAEAARRYGFAGHVTDWRDLLDDERIGLFDNSGPNNLHAEPTIAAAEAGKHVICEKPLGRDADESYETWQRVEAAGVKHMCAFNYRFVPAVRLARELIEAGELGEIHHFRGRLPAGVGRDGGDRRLALRQGAGRVGRARRPRRARDRPRPLPRRRDRRGVGADGDVLARDARSTTPSRPRCASTGGAVGTIEATRFATGRKNAFRWEVNGSKGSLAFDLERLNELQVHSRARPGRLVQGFRTVLVSRARPPVLGVLVAARGTSSAGSTPSCTSCTTC